MFWVLLTLLIGICGLWQLLTLIQAVENRRFSLRRMETRCRVRRREHRAMLVVPIKGGDPDTRENLASFFRQQHPDFQLVWVVESRDDPAVRHIEALQRQMPSIDCRLVIAGKSADHGQKVQNLLAATAEIAEDVGILAFADADIRPDPDWLQTLCRGVAKQKRAANTGYRWMLPERNTLANLVLYSVNATLGGTMGAGSHHLIWGGSWAVRRRWFDTLQIRSRWQRTLSDDLVASRVFKQQHLPIIYDPRCLCKARFDSDCSAAAEFLRRQFLIGRMYAPRIFWSALGIVGVNVIAFWSLVGVTLWANGLPGLLAPLCLAGLYGLNLAKGLLRQSVYRRRDSTVFRRYRAAAVFDILAWPLVASLTWLAMLSALTGTTLCWRGNHYRIRPGGQIELLNPKPGMRTRRTGGPAVPANRQRAA